MTKITPRMLETLNLLRTGKKDAAQAAPEAAKKSAKKSAKKAKAKPPAKPAHECMPSLLSEAAQRLQMMGMNLHRETGTAKVNQPVAELLTLSRMKLDVRREHLREMKPAKLKLLAAALGIQAKGRAQLISALCTTAAKAGAKIQPLTQEAA